MREDLPEDVRSERSDIRSVVLHARQLGHNANAKGDSAHIDGHVYRHQELDTLPRELSLAVAKTVSTQNTICFQGKHNPLSNFYESQIVNADGHVCNNAEQLFQAKKPLHLGRDDVAKKILALNDYILGMVSKGIGALRKALNQDALLTMYYSFIYPYIQRGAGIWANTCKRYMLDILLKQKQAVRIIAGARYLDHTVPLFKELNILPIDLLYKQQLLILMYNTFHKKMSRTHSQLL